MIASTSDLNRVVGQLEAKVELVQESVRGLKDDVKSSSEAINEQLVNIQTTLAETRGGSKMLIRVGAVSGAVFGSIAATIVAFFMGTPQ